MFSREESVFLLLAQGPICGIFPNEKDIDTNFITENYVHEFFFS